MPVVGISTDRLRRLLEKELDSERIAEAIDRIGCDLEEVAEVLLYECPACKNTVDRLPREEPPKDCTVCGHRAEAPFSEIGRDEVVRLDLLPARPDLFDCAGLSRALLGYLGIQTGLPDYAVEEGEIVVRVDPSVADVRPEIVCAEVEMPPLDQATLVEIMQLQENLHWAVGRDRKKASIGVYDLSSHGTEIRWTTEQRDYRFVPLGMPGREMTLGEILDEHGKGVRYAGLLEPYDRYPILVDGAGQVLSMPPIINSDETKLGVGATRLFVDVTGHDQRTVADALALIVTSLAELGGRIRSVRIERAGESVLTPDLEPRRIALDVARTARLIGVPMDEDHVVTCLSRMRLRVDDRTDGKLTVAYPRYRVDVKHEVDIIEDVAIAHGYHKLPSVLVPTMSVGKPHPRMQFARRVRETLSGLGFIEVVTYLLTNRDEHLVRMRLPEDLGQAKILNPISMNQEIVRTHLLSGLMTTFALNKTRELPQPIYEVGEVVAAGEGDVVHRHHLSIGVMGPRADYATIRATVDALATDLGVAAEVAPLGEHELSTVFLDGRAAVLSSGGREIGVLGEAHPEAITAFGLDQPIVLAEIDLEVLAGEAGE